MTAGLLARAPLCALLLGLGLLLVACGQLPQPFQPGGKTNVDLATWSERSRIQVLPISGHPPGGAKAEAARGGENLETLARALRAEGVPAEVAPRQGGGQRLGGWASRQDGANGEEQVTIEWRLVDDDGRIAATHRQQLRLLAGTWDSGDPAVQDELATAIAASLADVLLGPQARATRPVLASQPRLVLAPLPALPGDGRQSLRRALLAAMPAAGLELTEAPSAQDLMLRVRFTLTLPEPDWQDVTLVWHLTRADDGSELGKITQANRIPAGSLDGAWGSTAEIIAEGTAAGIRDLIDQAGGAR
jgi:hypothetical protein